MKDDVKEVFSSLSSSCNDSVENEEIKIQKSSPCVISVSASRSAFDSSSSSKDNNPQNESHKSLQNDSHLASSNAIMELLMKFAIYTESHKPLLLELPHPTLPLNPNKASYQDEIIGLFNFKNKENNSNSDIPKNSKKFKEDIEGDF